MERFRTSLFMGYNKDEVDEYIEMLTEKLNKLSSVAGINQENPELKGKMEALQSEMDNLQMEKNGLQSEMDNLKTKNISLQAERDSLQAERDSLRTANSDLQLQLMELESQVDRLTKEARERQVEQSFDANPVDSQLQEKMKDYDKKFAMLAVVLANAEVEKAQVVADAKANADKIVDEAKEKALQCQQEAEEKAMLCQREAEEKAALCQQEAEEKIKERWKEEEERHIIAKHRIKEYLKSLNKYQTQLVDTYNQLGRLVEGMPLRLENIIDGEFIESSDVKNENASDSDANA